MFVRLIGFRGEIVSSLEFFYSLPVRVASF